MSLIEKIKDRKPCYHLSFEEFIRSYAKYQGDNDENADLKFFNSVYEIYIYAAFIGLAKNKRYPMRDVSNKNKKDFWEIKNFKTVVDNLDYLLAILVSKNQNIDFLALDNCTGGEIIDAAKKIVLDLEEYSNGGLKIMKDIKEREPTYFEKETSFVNLLLAIKDKDSWIHNFI